MKRHRAPQYDLAGQELIFNLSGELKREEPPKPKPDTKPDHTMPFYQCGRLTFPMGPCGLEWGHNGPCNDGQPQDTK